MAFVDAFAQQLDVPGEPGEWMQLRPLSFIELELAERASYINGMKLIGQMGDVRETIAMVESIRQDSADASTKGDEAEAVSVAIAEAEQDVLQGLDQLTVLRTGIMNWSYGRPVDETSIRLLDHETARWAAEKIVGLRKKADLEKASPPSTQL